jgi:hypothetical protein
MKKLLAFLVIVGAAGFLVWKFVLAPAPERSCERLAALCGTKVTGLDGCVRGMTELGKSNKEAAAKFDSCVGGAKSCLEGGRGAWWAQASALRAARSVTSSRASATPSANEPAPPRRP